MIRARHGSMCFIWNISLHAHTNPMGWALLSLNCKWGSWGTGRLRRVLKDGRARVAPALITPPLLQGLRSTAARGIARPPMSALFSNLPMASCITQKKSQAPRKVHDILVTSSPIIHHPLHLISLCQSQPVTALSPFGSGTFQEYSAWGPRTYLCTPLLPIL